jgi:hypothetical protein
VPSSADDIPIDLIDSDMLSAWGGVAQPQQQCSRLSAGPTHTQAQRSLA